MKQKNVILYKDMQHILICLIKLIFCFLIFCQQTFSKKESRKSFILKEMKIKADNKSSRCLTLALSI